MRVKKRSCALLHSCLFFATLTQCLCHILRHFAHGIARANLAAHVDGLFQRDACLDDVVAEVGLDAKLGERGIGLSEGQDQRVARRKERQA